MCLFRKHLQNSAKLLGANCITDGLRNSISEIQLCLLSECSNLVLQYAFCASYSLFLAHNNNDLRCNVWFCSDWVYDKCSSTKCESCPVLILKENSVQTICRKCKEM